MVNQFDPSRKRRDRLYIIAEMLEVARNGALKTQIMYGANLSFAQLKEYLNFLLETGLLENTLRNDRILYQVTAKGLQYLQRNREIYELLKEKSDRGKLADLPY